MAYTKHTEVMRVNCASENHWIEIVYQRSLLTGPTHTYEYTLSSIKQEFKVFCYCYCGNYSILNFYDQFLGLVAC